MAVRANDFHCEHRAERAGAEAAGLQRLQQIRSLRLQIGFDRWTLFANAIQELQGIQFGAGVLQRGAQPSCLVVERLVIVEIGCVDSAGGTA